ncbi:hypothetical protein SAMN05428988_4170 [Chitinophaga sp. YR573]|uniref:hypothetical protein n=1 Tax=Chitinophaga sp. YR573 TaxID=1881040 RepID=UPI0008D5F9B3|nr:hypothetical protein [Chitinophaga sp. YR573]SEW34600.1 hypothetical protein SAMN05428988_4170 [Chitinophaga sp. YR573]
MNEINFWPRVIEFIRQRDPVFLSKIAGVPGETISALMTEHCITLPAAYITFLQLMGANSNGFNPFGPTGDHHFATIIKRLKEPSGQFFPVDGDALLETNETFCERIISSVFYHFGLRGLAAKSEIRMHEPGAYQEVLSLLLSMGLMSTLPMLERVSCLQGGPLIIIVEVNESLTLNFGSNDPKAVKTLSKQLLANPLIQPK